MQVGLLSALFLIALIARLVISSGISLPLGRSSRSNRSVLLSVPALVASLRVLRSTGSNSGLVELKRGGGGLLGLGGDGVALRDGFVYVGWHKATGSLVRNHFYWMDGVDLGGNRSLFDGGWCHDEGDLSLTDVVRVEVGRVE
jgi:hypothetical protein